MRKKICIFCSLSSFDTGMPISTYKLAAGLAESGRFDVCAVMPEEGELAERLRGAGVDVRIIPFCRLRGGFLSSLRFGAAYVRAGLTLCRFIGKNNIDIVHFSDIIDAPFYPIAHIAGSKAVAHVRACIGGPAARRMFRLWACIFCDRVIAISKFAKRYYGFGRRAAVVYNPGPDRTLFNPERFSGLPSGASSGGAPTVIAVSTFRRDKGHHNFLEIAARVKERMSGNVRFVIVGGRVDGHEDYYDEMTVMAERLGVGGCLTVTGNLPHEDVARAMAGASVLLHVPGWEEALGGVILEAMAMGVVPVAYDCGGIGECFADGVSGFLIKRGDFDGAADRIIRLLESPELREQVAAEAQLELDSKFTMPSYINSIEKIYNDMEDTLPSKPFLEGTLTK